MLLRYIEEETGQQIDFVGWIVDPLGYDDLIGLHRIKA